MRTRKRRTSRAQVRRLTLCRVKNAGVISVNPNARFRRFFASGRRARISRTSYGRIGAYARRFFGNRRLSYVPTSAKGTVSKMPAGPEREPAVFLSQYGPRQILRHVKISLQGSASDSFVRESAPGKHRYTVSRQAVTTHLCMLCSVPAQVYANKTRQAVRQALRLCLLLFLTAQ